jgi:hypothetical protein
MKSRLPALPALLIGSLTLLSCTDTYYSAQVRYPDGPHSVEVSVFYNDLTPYGSWVASASYGEVWVPRVSPWWRPYSEGHWVMSDDGWTWIADEPWGWGPFHYGRWYADASLGWAWVPGRVWAPAWVAWRSGGGHVGWAALPPQVSWEGGAEFEANRYDLDAWIAPQHWCFVDERYMTAPVIHEYLIPPARNVTYVQVTTNVTHYTVVENHIVNHGIDVAHVERTTEHAVPRYRIVDRQTAGATSASQGQVSIYRPVGHGSHQPPPQAAAGHVEPRQPVATPGPHATPSADEIARRHESERQELQHHQEEERTRVRQQQDAEQRQASEHAATEETRKRHEAEQQALARQHQAEQQALERRQKEERAAHTKPPASASASKEKKEKEKKDSGAK